MRKDLEVFENRSDDWLAKQRKHEEKVSAWDFDEGKRIKEEHHQIHEAYNKQKEIRKNIRSGTNVSMYKIDPRIGPLILLIISFTIIFTLFILSMVY